MICSPRLSPGFVPCVYSGGGIALGLHRSLPLLARARPATVMLHSGPDDLALHGPKACNDLRAALPGVEIWLAIGCDFRLRQQRNAGRYDGRAVVSHLATIGDTAKTCGATVAMLDPEGEWKPFTAKDRRVADRTARDTLAEIHRRAPGLTLAFTSYDHPTLHSGFNWSGWLQGTPITLAFAQVYAAAEEGQLSPRGALERRETRALASWKEAVSKGWIEPDIAPDDPALDPPDDLDWYPYLQLHGVPAVDTVREGVAHLMGAGWALTERMDEEGERALLAICELRRLGYWGRDAVQRFQSAMGLKVDGIAGPKTMAALGIT